MLKRLELNGFKSFARKTELLFDAPITAIVGPNGSGKSNVAEALRWVLGEQSMKSLRGKRGEDLIFSGSQDVGRLNRASVTIVFDNAKRIFPSIDFDEVAISREVFRDGVNNYLINGSPVRLRDVYEVLSNVSLGASGHHIISQGEADRILNANGKERKGMIEDALGLKIFQYKKQESERKLEKTNENLKEAESLRREIAPHIKFLKKQVDELARAEGLRTDLSALYQVFFAVEAHYISTTSALLSGEKEKLETNLRTFEEKIRMARETLGREGEDDPDQAQILKIDELLREVGGRREELSRELGKIEGQLLLRDKRDSFIVERGGEERCRYCGQVIVEITTTPNENNREEEFRHLEEEKRRLEEEISQTEAKSRELIASREAHARAREDRGKGLRAAERALFEVTTERNQCASLLREVELKRENLEREREDCEREKAEARTLVGESVFLPMESLPVSSRVEQDERRKKIERLKIRLEDSGLVGPEALREYKEVTDRDEFLAREIEDLTRSTVALKELMKELEVTLEGRFRDGISKINEEFQNFFAILFGGGTASLRVEKIEQRRRLTEAEIAELDLDTPPEEEGVQETGIEIAVSLPRKKIRGLEQLSGGERALTSIALLFAMSQVNPPPFMVLDETDAALDEANSRKYGDMIVALSSKSQLILITHNRETMSRAQIIYGVTMGKDPISKLFSIRFEEAAEFAK